MALNDSGTLSLLYEHELSSYGSVQRVGSCWENYPVGAMLMSQEIQSQTGERTNFSWGPCSYGSTPFMFTHCLTNLSYGSIPFMLIIPLSHFLLHANHACMPHTLCTLVQPSETCRRQRLTQVSQVSLPNSTYGLLVDLEEYSQLLFMLVKHFAQRMDVEGPQHVVKNGHLMLQQA